MRIAASDQNQDPTHRVVQAIAEDARAGQIATRLIAMCDGFVTAASIGPVRTGLDDWLRVIFANPSDRVSPEAIDTIRLALSVGHARFLSRLEAEDVDYMPDFASLETEAERLEHARAWAGGFVEAMRLSDEAWQAAGKNDVIRRAVGCIGLFLEPEVVEGIVEGLDAGELAERRRKVLGHLGEIICLLEEFWREQRESGRRPSRDLARLGRNDPCPCGSGRKFKRCCMN